MGFFEPPLPMSHFAIFYSKPSPSVSFKKTGKL